ncbi:MAG: response regulator, partial [Deltaproteobacteria bacterium]|nr:response regulator [Deltaproteobacteria bacterium]
GVTNKAKTLKSKGGDVFILLTTDSHISLLKDDFIEVEGKKLWKKDSPMLQKWAQQNGSATGTHQREFRCRSAEGEEQEWRWKRSLSKLLLDESGKGYIGESGIVFDITEEHEIKNELIRAKYDAEEASRAKSDFLARMSHEIRTPMNAIIGMTHLLLRTQLNDTQRDYQTKIQTSAQALMGIINDILDFSKIEAGKMGLENIPFRLDEVFNSLADVTLIKAQEKQLEVIFSVSDDAPQWLVGDSLRLSQVLINLTNNAVKFTHKGEILINVGVMEQTDSQVQLHFSITDSGIGLTAEQIQNLFQPFSQADGSITRKFGGTGLGLAICKSLVEAMGGSIWVESQPDKGSSFHFTVRLALAPDQPAKLFLPQDLRQLRTLIIDDNSTARNSFAEMLGAIFSLSPDTASSSDSAIEKIDRQSEMNTPYDLIFVDWQMPDIDGIETTRLIKEKTGGTKDKTSVVLMINGYELEKIRAAAKLAGVDAFLTKPTCPSNIFDTVANLYGKDSGSCKTTHIEVSREKLNQVRGTRILLVEDNLFNQQVAREFLEQAGMVVEIAENGFAALEAVENKKFDLVFMDIQMPDLDGLEATRRLRKGKDSSSLPIVAMTAHAMSEDREKSLTAGMNDHITKPIDPEELMSMLIKWGKKRPGGEKTTDISLFQINHSDNKETDLTPYRFSEIDAEEGLRRCMGNARSYLKFLKMFHQEYYDFTQRCEQNMMASEYENVRHIAHAIKGPAGSIGAKKLHAAAHDLEQAIWNGEKAYYDRLFKSFQESLRTVIRDLTPIMKQADKKATEVAEDFSAFDWAPEKRQELLTQLRTSLEKNDAGSVAILPEFRRVLAANEALSEEWALLQSQIENFDFGDALDTLTKIEKWQEIQEGFENGGGKASNSYC